MSQPNYRQKDYFPKMLCPTAEQFKILYAYFETYIQNKYETILKAGGGPDEIVDQLKEFVEYKWYLANFVNDVEIMAGISQGALDGEWYHLEVIAKVILEMDIQSKLTEFVIENEDLLDAYNEVRNEK